MEGELVVVAEGHEHGDGDGAARAAIEAATDDDATLLADDRRARFCAAIDGRRGITLGEAIELASESELVLKTLGEHVFTRFVEIKRQEWEEYRGQVSAFERDRMLPVI